jgi:hypothetical protein
MVFNFGLRPPAGQPVTPAVRSTPPTEMQQSSGFTEVLKQPEVQAALIQFGINMLQPTYSGFGGQLGRSIGAAGAAAGRAAGQRGQAAEEARKREIENLKLGFEERRVSASEKRANRTGGLTSMFSKPKSFPEFLQRQAELETSNQFDVSANELMNDEGWRQQQYQLWLETNRQGAAGLEGTGQSGGVTPSAARITSQEQFDALPSGALFINPATGTVMRKK